VEVIDVIDDKKTHHQEVQKHPDVMTQMEKKYMSFGNQADVARKELCGTDPACSMSIFESPSLSRCADKLVPNVNSM
jgi:hypothetical protein